ncbi:MAG: helix-turn-helix domain-containing protein [Firmicutes bacterium]|nr:helix-turn-helix domain-containing protein [Bacillota bacterium]
MIFDERLTELRKETPLNQKDFADKMGLEPSKYNKWENGKTVPDFETVIMLANFFNVTVDYLVGNSDVRKWENADINEILGLTDGGIKTIKGLKISGTKLTSNDPDFLSEDGRLLIDVFNAMLENDEYFKHFLTAIKVLSNPETATTYIDPKKNESFGAYMHINDNDTQRYIYKNIAKDILGYLINNVGGTEEFHW